MIKTSLTNIRDITTMGKQSNSKSPEVTKSKEVTIVPSIDVTKTKESKLSLKSVNSLLGNLDGFTPQEQKNIQDVMKTLQDKGKVTSGQGGGSSTDTPEMIDFRKNFDTHIFIIHKHPRRGSRLSPRYSLPFSHLIFLVNFDTSSTYAEFGYY